MKTMNRKQAEELIQRYDSGLASAEEKAMLDNWFLHESQQSAFTEEDHKFLMLKSEIWGATMKQAGLAPVARKVRIGLWAGIAAAIALITLSAALLIYISSNPSHGVNEHYANDVAPGGNKATLTLADGKKISLTEAEQGNLALQAGVIITKLADGKIIYSVIATDESTDPAGIMENTISTPNGGKYEIILPDGTKVILNSASSLTFPTAFIGSEREVKLDGEAYFEVAKDKGKRFIVNSGIQSVEVLGTHFNINAYADEQSIKTTLVEGSVKVSAGQYSTLLVPGQQSVTGRDGTRNISKSYVDVEKEIAWKNGILSFEQDDVKSVMRKISKWYDVAIEYSGVFPDERFFGEISRQSNLSEVARILELNNIHLEIKGKTVKVSYVPSSSSKSSSNKIN